MKSVPNLTCLSQEAAETRNLSVGSHFAPRDLFHHSPDHLIVTICLMSFSHCQHVGSMRARVSMAEKSGHSGYRGDDDNGNDHEAKVVPDDWDVSEIIPTENKKRDPDDSCYHVVHHKPAVRHIPKASHKRGKCSDDRDEPRDDDRFSTMLFKELMRACKILFIQETHVLLLQNSGTHEVTDPVVDEIPDDCRGGKDYYQPKGVQRAGRGKCPSRKE